MLCVSCRPLGSHLNADFCAVSITETAFAMLSAPHPLNASPGPHIVQKVDIKRTKSMHPRALPVAKM